MKNIGSSRAANVSARAKMSRYHFLKTSKLMIFKKKMSFGIVGIYLIIAACFGPLSQQATGFWLEPNQAIKKLARSTPIPKSQFGHFDSK